MSRANQQENSNPVQLFPFVAVLLCTMGSLLVLLVGVARSSRDQAHVQAAAAREIAAAEPPLDESALRKLEQLKRYLARLKQQESLASEQLNNDQLQLGHLEDHMRRLQSQLESLKLAAVELNSLEESHFDDLEQGQRELARLHELAAERKVAIEELRKEIGSRRAYAILPFKTANGTRRPPIYFECSADRILLQPEGINFVTYDFLGPPGPRSTAAVVFRAAREHIVDQLTTQNASSEIEPYALIIVRPDGNVGLQLLQKVFGASGIDFGYEVVESEAVINYPPSNPQLMAVEIQAIQTARGRLKMLAQSAPGIYGIDAIPQHYGLEGAAEEVESDEKEYAGDEEAIVDEVDDDVDAEKKGRKFAIDSPMDIDGGGQIYVSKEAQSTGTHARDGGKVVVASPVRRGTMGDVVGGAPAVGGMPASPDHPGVSRVTGSGADGSPASTASAADGGRSSAGPAGPAGPAGTHVATGGAPASGGAAPSGGPPPPPGAVVGGPSPVASHAAKGSVGMGTPVGSSLPNFGEFDPNAVPANERSNGGTSALGSDSGREMAGAPTNSANHRHINQLDQEVEGQQRKPKMKYRGKNWAIMNRASGSVPIRRTIRVAVRGDALAILPEHGANDEAAVGREIPLIGQTSLARDEFATAIESHIRAWGMAGQGLYWRPVIEMVVGPDGQERAGDVARMLNNSGIEVRSNDVAQAAEGGDSRANR